MSSILKQMLVAGLLIGLVGCSGKPDGDKKAPDGENPPGKAADAGAKPSSDSADIPAALEGPKQSLDLSYIAPQFFAAVVVHPQSIAKSSLVSSLPQDELLGDVIKSVRLDPRDIEQAIVLVAPDAVVAAGQGDYVPGAILRFTKAIDGKAFLSEHWDNLEETTIEGKPCYTSQFPQGPTVAVHFPDEKTAVFASEETLAEMLAAEGAKSPLLERLGQVDARGDVIAVASLEPLQPMINEMAAGMEGNSEVPPAVGALMVALKDLKAASITLDLTRPVLVRIELDGHDTEAAGRLDGVVGGNLDLAKQMFDQTRDMLAMQMPPEMAKPVVGLVDEFLAGIDVGKKAGQVVVTANRPKSLDDVVTKLTPLAMDAREEARQAAMRAQRMNRLRQISIAMLMHDQDKEAFPAAAIRDKEGKALLSWRVAILPYLGEEELYKQFHLDEPWDSEHNKKLVDRMPEVYKSAGIEEPGKTALMVFTGEGTPFGGEEGPDAASISDGMSNTLAVVEAGADKSAAWSCPQDLAFDKASPVAPLGTIEGDGFLAAFFDGSVRVIEKDIDAETLRRLIQHADGEPVDLD